MEKCKVNIGNVPKVKYRKNYKAYYKKSCVPIANSQASVLLVIVI